MSEPPKSFSRILQSARHFWRGLWSKEGSIAQKSVRGGTWMLAGTGIMRLLHMVQTAILARLLIPDDFGLMRLVMVAMSASSAFSNFGISSALIQRKEMTRRFMDTAWMMDLLRNLLMFAAAYLVAAPMATFYGEPSLGLLVRVVAVKFIFMGFSNNSGLAMLRREMNFRRKQFYEVIINLVGTGVTVALAFWLRSVWALALAQLYYGFAELVGSYIVHPFRPRFRIYWAEARDLFHFGKHLFLGGLLTFFRGSLASLMLGKLLGTEALGYYSLAQSLVLSPVAVVAPIFTAVLYPAYSRLQDRLVTLRRAFLRSLGFGCLVLSPVLVGIAVTARPLVYFVYGPRYAPVAPVSVLFCLVQFFVFVARPASQLLTARGKPGLTNLGKLLHPAIFLPFLFPLAYQYGTLGVVGALGAAAAGEMLLLMWLVCREIGLPASAPVLAAGRPALASVLMGLCVWGLGTTVSHSAALSLVVMVPAGVLLYGLWSAVINRPGWADAFRAVATVGET